MLRHCGKVGRVSAVRDAHGDTFVEIAVFSNRLCTVFTHRNAHPGTPFLSVFRNFSPLSTRFITKTAFKNISFNYFGANLCKTNNPLLFNSVWTHKLIYEGN